MARCACSAEISLGNGGVVVHAATTGTAPINAGLSWPQVAIAGVAKERPRNRDYQLEGARLQLMRLSLHEADDVGGTNSAQLDRFVAGTTEQETTRGHAVGSRDGGRQRCTKGPPAKEEQQLPRCRHHVAARCRLAVAARTIVAAVERLDVRLAGPARST